MEQVSLLPDEEQLSFCSLTLFPDAERLQHTASCQQEAELIFVLWKITGVPGMRPGRVLDRQEDRWAGSKNGNAIFIR